jgi:hypothetical protein
MLLEDPPNSTVRSVFRSYIEWILGCAAPQLSEGPRILTGRGRTDLACVSPCDGWS